MSFVFGRNYLMDKLVIDSAFQAKLDALREQVELCDEQGRTLGHFLPTNIYREMLVAWSKERITDDELERRLNAPGGHTLPEIWDRLGRS